MANFSSKKKVSNPPSNAANKLRGSALDSNASGNACSNEVDNMMPTERLTILSTTLERRANEKTAAAEILMIPAIVVANKIEISVELIFDPSV